MSYISAQLNYDRTEVLVWERNSDGQRTIKRYDAPYYFYREDDEGEYLDIYGKKLSRLDYPNNETFRSAIQNFKNAGEKLFESDISPEYKILSSKYYQKPYPRLNVTFFDIEVDYDKTKGFADAQTDPYAPINAVSFYHKHTDKMVVYAVPPTPDWKLKDIPEDLRAIATIVLCKNEQQLLRYFLDEIADSDILSGWNSEGYDIPYLYARIKMVLGEKVANRLSFDQARKPYYKEIMDRNGVTKNIVIISGRVHLDLMQLVTKFEPGERDSFALESVAEDILEDMEKLTYEGSLADLYRNDFAYFVRYNTRDCEILKGIEEKKGFIQLAIMLSHMDTTPIEDVLGTIKLTEMAIVNYCHNVLDRIVPDCNKDIDPNAAKYDGAYVLSPQEGLHEWVGSIDVTSLYPSAMRTVNVSPEVLVGQFVDKTDGYIQVKVESEKELSVEMLDGSFETRPAKEWKKILLANKWAVSGHGTIFDMQRQGIIPALLTQWFSQRKEYRKIAVAAEKKYLELEGTPEAAIHYDEYRFNDLLQMTFKLKLNSTYGACGNQYFRFYDVRLAESTTKTGREVLFHMARTIGKLFHGEYMYPNPSVIYGDTDSCYFKTHGKDKEESFAIATAIAKEINKSFVEFSRQSFCCVEGFDQFLSVSQEIIADRAIFINGKKNYMAHLVKKDGNDVDKMKVTGLAIKKTTLPKPVRVKLTGEMEKFLKGDNWEAVGVRILEFKEELLSSTDLRILGLPKKIKGLEEYTSRYNNNEPDLRVPGHVMAAMFWNKCLESYADKGSFKIVSGMRIRIFYLNKPFGKFKSIAMPVDLDVVPEWFTTHFIPLIDKKAQVLRLVDMPMKSLLKAIKERIPTRQVLLMNELLGY